MVIVQINALVFILQLFSPRGYTAMKPPFLWTISRDILFFQDLYVSSWLYSESRDALDTQTGFFVFLAHWHIAVSYDSYLGTKWPETQMYIH